MKKIVLAFALAAPLLAVPVHAKPALFSTREKVIKVAELPNDEALKVSKVTIGYKQFPLPTFFMDVGYCYKQLQVAYLPVWNWDEKYCGYADDNTYTETSREELLEISRALSVDTAWDDGKSKISLWERIGGKAVLAAVLALLVAIRIWRQRRA